MRMIVYSVDGGGRSSEHKPSHLLYTHPRCCERRTRMYTPSSSSEMNTSHVLHVLSCVLRAMLYVIFRFKRRRRTDTVPTDDR